MKHFLCLLLLYSCFSRKAASFDSFNNIDNLVESYRCVFKVPGVSIALVYGEDEWSKGYGLANIEENIPVTSQTLFPINSCTKPITTLMMSNLVENGFFSWEDPISDYIPYFKLKDPYTSSIICIRDYLTHLSGYPNQDWIWYGENLTREEIVKRMKYLTPRHQLREKFSYQNIGFTIAAHVAEVATNKDWDTLISTIIFDHLNMQNSMSQIPSNLDVTGYHEHEDDMFPITITCLDAISPSGGIVSNSDDMTKLVRCMLDNGNGLVCESTWKELLKPRVVSDFFCTSIPQVNDLVPIECYSMGWFMVSYRGNIVYLHPGNTEGFSSFIFLVPKVHFGGIIMTNKHITPLPWVLSANLIDRALSLEEIDWMSRLSEIQEILNDFNTKGRVNHIVHTNEDQPRFTGLYSHPGYGTLLVEATPYGSLSLVKKNLKLPLNHIYHNVFEISETHRPYLENLQVSFALDHDGKISSLSIPLEGDSSDVIFQKVSQNSISTSDDLGRFVGTYIYNSYIKFKIEISDEENLLKATPNLMDKTYILLPMPHTKYQFYVRDNSGWVVEFLHDERGQITAVELRNEEKKFSAKRY